MTDHDAIPVARLELEQLRRDALRYRWVRSHPDAWDYLQSFSGDALDDEIDAAIADTHDDKPDDKVQKGGWSDWRERTDNRTDGK